MKKAFFFGDKSIESAVRRVNEVRLVGVIGAGTMGRGIIVDLLAKTDYDLMVLAGSQEALDRTAAPP